MSASGEDAGSPEQIWTLHLGSTLPTILLHLYEYIQLLGQLQRARLS